MADKAKFAYGSLANLNAAVSAGKIDEFDLLCLVDDGVARIGWLDRNKQPVLVDTEPRVVSVDTLPTVGESGVIYIVGEIVYIWAGGKFIAISESTDLTALKEHVSVFEEKVSALEEKATALEEKDVALEEKDAALEAEIAALKEKDTVIDAEVAKKADAEQVAANIEQAEANAVAEANAYADKLAKEVAAKCTSKKYEIAKAPVGTLVDYFDKEIRVMVPKATDFANLNNGIAGAEDMRYIECRIYAPEGAVEFKSDLGGMVMTGKVENFAKFTDEHGRIYIVALPSIARYDAQSAAWVYLGVDSTNEHYVGWDENVYWYDENGVMIASDSIRINLSNEDCHLNIEPYYIGKMMQTIEEKIDAKIEEIAEIPVVEF